MKWTDSDSLRLVELFNDGLTDKQIGIELGRTDSAICNMRKRMELLRRVVAPASKPVYQPTNVYLDCMDWPFPLERPRTRGIII